MANRCKTKMTAVWWYVFARAAAIFMLLWASQKHPYVYYQFLRFVVCGVTGYSSYLSYKRKDFTWAWILGAAAVLFNPLAPFHFKRGTWGILDDAAAIIVALSFFFVKI